MRIVDLSFPIKPHFRWKALSERPATHAAGDPLQSTVMTISLPRLHARGRAAALPA